MEMLARGHPARPCRVHGSPRLLLLALLLACALPAVAAEPAGRVISLVGMVRAADSDGAARALARGDAVQAGDTLTLGPRAHAQIRMRDDALIELEAGARFAIPVYSESATGGSAVMRLLRGAMRTISGAIGDGPNETYRVDTPVATIGIRGTEYALHYCNGGCASEQRAGGLYGRVEAGAVVARNEAARRVFREREYFHVAAQDVAPREIVRPPQGILDGGAVSRGALRSGDTDPIGALAPADPDDAFDATIDGADQTLGDTVEGAGDVVGDTLDGGADLAGGALDGDLDAGQTLDDTADLAGDTFDGTTDLADDTLDGAGDTLGTTVDDTTDTLNDTTDLLDNDGQ